jgi:hypothetical protein
VAGLLSRPAVTDARGIAKKLLSLAWLAEDTDGEATDALRLRWSRATTRPQTKAWLFGALSPLDAETRRQVRLLLRPEACHGGYPAPICKEAARLFDEFSERFDTEP